MTDTPYEDTDQRIGGHDAPTDCPGCGGEGHAIEGGCEDCNAADAYVLAYRIFSYREWHIRDSEATCADDAAANNDLGNDVYESAMALKYPLRDDVEPLQDWED